MRKSIIFALITIILMYSAALSQDGWQVTDSRPTPIGPQVAAGAHSNANPDATWVAHADGLAQAVIYDHDIKCDEAAGYVQVEATVMPIPTAPFRPGGDCSNPVDYLWSSIVFTVSQSNLVAIEQGETSGRFFLNFATHTPTPDVEPPETVEPPTATTTPTPTPTATATPTVTATPTLTPTPTATQEPPVIASRCLSVRTQPPLADAIPASGVQVDIWVEAVNPVGYTLFDGEGVLYFEEQPIRSLTIYPGVTYKVTVSTDDEGCLFGNLPTGLPPSHQPAQQFTLSLPYLANGALTAPVAK